MIISEKMHIRDWLNQLLRQEHACSTAADQVKTDSGTEWASMRLWRNGTQLMLSVNTVSVEHTLIW